MNLSSKKTTPLLLLLLILISLVTPGNNRPIRVNTVTAMQEAAGRALPGDTIFLADGVYRGERTDLSATGRSGHPVVIAAETPGKVTIESPLRLSGSHLNHGLLNIKSSRDNKTPPAHRGASPSKYSISAQQFQIHPLRRRQPDWWLSSRW